MSTNRKILYLSTGLVIVILAYTLFVVKGRPSPEIPQPSPTVAKETPLKFYPSQGKE